jgi:hypothetical protein
MAQRIWRTFGLLGPYAPPGICFFDQHSTLVCS